MSRVVRDGKNPFTTALLGALGGGVLVAGVVWLHHDPEPTLATPEAPALAAGPASAPTMPSAPLDLSPVTTRLDAVNERLRALEQRSALIEAALAMPARTSATDRGPDKVAIDVESLQGALEQIEQRKLDGLAEDDLLRTARIAAKEGDVADAIRRVQALLQRPLTRDKRAEVLLELATLHRQRGTPESLQESERTLQEVIDTNGAASKAGRGAAYQMIWTSAAQKDSARALALADAFANAPGATPNQRIEGRWATAVLVHGTGDTARARTLYESLLRELSDSDEYAKLASDIRQRLAKL